MACHRVRRNRVIFILAFGLLAAAWRPASAAGADPCEKFKDADAYNACLASFGPAVGRHNVTRSPPAASVSAAPRRHETRAGRHRTAPKPGGKRQAKGRVRIEIYPGK